MILLPTLALIVSIAVPSAISDFAPLTKLSGKDVTDDVFGGGDRRANVFPTAYGDFNSDKLTDMVTIAYNRSSIIIYLGFEEPPLLRKYIKCDIQTKRETGTRGIVSIVGVAMGDFTGDGLMDILVSMTQTNVNYTEVLIFEGTGKDLICDSTSAINGTADTIKMVQEPLILDVDGDMIMDLLGEVYEQKGNDTIKKRKIWIYKKELKLNPTVLNFEVDGEDDMNPMIVPSANAFVDVDGDMIPELVIMTLKSEKSSSHHMIEYYNVFKIDAHKVTFTTRQPVSLDNSTPDSVYGQPIFMDLNQDGRLFHLIPYCSQHSCSAGNKGILVVYHNEITNLAIGFKEKFTFVIENQDIRWDHHYSQTIVLRAGDYNLDGYPDLIGIVEKRDGPIRESQAVIFENVPCDGTETPCTIPRTFKINYEVLQHYKHVSMASFYDIYEDGLIDVVLVRSTNNNTKRGEDTYEVRAFQNSPDYDANFMKVMVLSGVKCPRCPNDEIPYGNIIPGPIISYKTKTQSGSPQIAIAAQFYRSSHMPLDLPCTIFGIGHSPNFVENLHVNIGSYVYNETHAWPQIIPNSQIIVIPSPPDKSKQWKAKLFLTPSKAVLNTFAVLMAFCVVVFSIVIILQYKERREDKKEKLNEARQFHMM